jgi:hypothetical protein
MNARFVGARAVFSGTDSTPGFRFLTWLLAQDDVAATLTPFNRAAFRGVFGRTGTSSNGPRCFVRSVVVLSQRHIEFIKRNTAVGLVPRALQMVRRFAKRSRPIAKEVGMGNPAEKTTGRPQRTESILKSP